MKIVADENIPFVSELFEPIGEVVLRPGRAIKNKDLADADILLVRSVTKVDEELLARSNVEFVGSCTIGCDHLDSQYLNANDIVFSTAPGCNANAVVQYVVSVLASLNAFERCRSVVVVGGGNVGSRVYRTLSKLGFDCHCVDPFLDENSGLDLVDFSAVYDADIVCLHTPLTESGAHPTKHMLALKELKCLKPDVLLINAGRGGVIDNRALLDYRKQNSRMELVLDVWENEPNIDPELLASVTLGTPHIAGYSFEGRVTGSLMIFEALCRYLDFGQVVAQGIRDGVVERAFGPPATVNEQSFVETILSIYDVRHDFKALRSSRVSLGHNFDQLRKNYPKRREFSHYICTQDSPDLARYRGVGFVIG